MCGILVYKKKKSRLFPWVKKGGNNSYIRRRGPDGTNVIEKNGYNFVHNLLSITGEYISQPYVDGDIYMLYNGEIYNHSFEKSDGEVIIPLYRKYGENFLKYLDGEFAIALYDFENSKIIFATDVFGTKPLWVNEDECASYESGVGGRKVPANTIIVNGESRNWHKFEWRQYKETYDDWVTAFENAIRKRAKNECFIGLSSGYDSGGIDLALSKSPVDYEKYSITGSEDPDILRKRNGRVLHFTEKEQREQKDFLSKNVEPYEYTIKTEAENIITKKIHSDKAIYGLGHICKVARQEKREIYLSGQGADEILCDYSKFPVQSELKGYYPKELRPWSNFYGNCMENYLMKEEYIAGAYGIETRYPYLDKNVVQEFLWLSQELKNKIYKAPLDYYLTLHDYPFQREEKKGFNPLGNKVIIGQGNSK